MRLRAAWALLGVAACGGGAAVSPPEEALGAWVTAVEEGRCDDAGRMMDGETRGGRTREEWAEWCRLNLEPLRREARTIREELAAGELEVVARIDLDHARAAELRMHEGRWYLMAEPAPALGGETPMEALAALLAASEAPVSAPLLEVSGVRGASSSLSHALAAARRMNAGDPTTVEVSGDAAMLSVANYRVTFRRQDGLWRVEGATDTTGAYGLNEGP